MKFLEAAKSAPARYALAYAGITALAISVLLALIYGWTTALLTRHLEEATQHQLSVLVDAYERDGMTLLMSLAKQQTQRNAESSIRVIVQGDNSKPLIGNAPDFDPIEGWQDIKVSDVSTDLRTSDPMYYRALGTYLDNGVFLLVMHNIADLLQTQNLLINSFVSTLGVTIALALIGGLFIGDAMLRRVDAVNQTAKAIMQGDLSQRVPTDRRHDELSDLADNLNHMFSRIQSLMEDLRHVSSNIAHDLRSPLGRHRQKLEAILLNPNATKQDCHRAIDSAIHEVDTLLKTFDAMLRITEIEAGLLRGRFHVVNLSHCVNNVIDAYMVVAEDQMKAIRVQIEPNVEVVGDQELLSQAVVNIIENALRHTNINTDIDIIVGIRANHPFLTITDNGPGIPEYERANVFQRFYRLDNSRSTPGSGLGLSFVKAVTDLHLAKVSLDDALPGLIVAIDFPSQKTFNTTPLN